MLQEKQLNSKNLASRIRKLAPLAIDEAVVDQLLSDLQANKDRVGSESPDVQALKNSLNLNLQFLKPEARVSLDKDVDLYVLPYRPCIAFSQICDKTDRGQIVISQGMIDLVTASIYDATIQEIIPETLHSTPVGSLKKPLLLLLNTCTALLRYRFYRFAEPLPDFHRIPLPYQAQLNCHASVPGALTFLLLHELGHIQLGHLEGSEARMSHYDMAFAQQLSDYQLQEAEADEFALDSLRDEAQILGPYWMAQALAFFVTLELLSGHVDSAHPLAINRHHVTERRLQRIPELAQNPSVANEFARRFAEIVHFGPPGKDFPLLETPRADIIVALLEVIRVLKQNDVDLTALLPSLSTS